MGPESEPQPDGCLFLRPECGGQVVVRDDYLVGAPELIAEVAFATESIDLHSKKDDYEKHGVREYVVLALRQERAFWFRLEDDKYVEQPPDADGIYRSRTFPGLWLDPAAVFDQDYVRLRTVTQAGLASPEHAAFVAELAHRLSAAKL